MGRFPASERPRSCSLGTGPFVFSGAALATLLAPSSFACRINGLRGHRAPASVTAAKIVTSVPSESSQGAAQKPKRCRSQAVAQHIRLFAHMVDRLFLLLRCGERALS
jgi:hypothetical protein